MLQVCCHVNSDFCRCTAAACVFPSFGSFLVGTNCFYILLPVPYCILLFVCCRSFSGGPLISLVLFSLLAGLISRSSSPILTRCIPIQALRPCTHNNTMHSIPNDFSFYKSFYYPGLYILYPGSYVTNDHLQMGLQECVSFVHM